MVIGVLDHDDIHGCLHCHHALYLARNIHSRYLTKKGTPRCACCHIPADVPITKVISLRKAEPEKNKESYAKHKKMDWTFTGVIHRTLYRPFYMLYKEPILVLVTLYLSV